MRVQLVAVVVASVAGASASASAQDAARPGVGTGAGSHVVDITGEPSHHRVLDNAYVRVFDVRVAPHATTLVHRHRRDYLFVTLGDAEVTTTRLGEPPVRLVARDGEVRFTPGGFAHSATNDGDRPFHNTTIELRQPTTHAGSCTDGCAEATECPAAGDASGSRACPVAQLLASADEWRVSTATLPAGADLAVPDTVGGVLVVGVSGVQLAVAGERGGAGIRGGPGVLGWIPAPSHVTGAPHLAARVITNTGRAPARIVLLEFRRPPSPRRPTAPAS